MLGVPGVDTGKIDVLPAERGDVLEEAVGQISSALPEMRHRTAEIDRVPVDNSTDDKIETGSAEGLALEGTVADFPALVEKTARLSL